MAKGDVIGDVIGIAAAGVLTFQPGAGVECVISNVFTSSQAADMTVRINDGAEDAALGANVDSIVNTKIFISNAVYIELVNTNASLQNLGYTGIQVK